jgi:hypothetical protein
MCGWPGKTGEAFRFSLTFSPFFVKKKGMASAAKERKKISVINILIANKLKKNHSIHSIICIKVQDRMGYDMSHH